MPDTENNQPVSTSNRKRLRWLTVLLGCSLLLVGVGIVYPLSRSTNCGGNTAALYRCKTTALTIKLETGARQSVWNIADLNQGQRKQIIDLANNHWNPGSTLLIRSHFSPQSNDHVPLIVCDTAYDNIPQPGWWNLYKRTPRHVVAYTDGSTALITPEEYRQLDLRDYVDAKSFATNSTGPARLPNN